MEIDDKQAILILKAGNLEGLEHLVRSCQHEAVRMSTFIISDVLMAEDIVQGAFLKVAEKIHQFDEQLAFKPWFYKIL
jgi:DNA-directed RNA polymerase specialized sigma24 family protein